MPCSVTCSSDIGTPYICIREIFYACWVLTLKHGLFSGVRGRGILRTSPYQSSRKFTSSIMRRTGPIQQAVLCRVAEVHSPTYRRHGHHRPVLWLLIGYANRTARMNYSLMDSEIYLLLRRPAT